MKANIFSWFLKNKKNTFSDQDEWIREEKNNETKQLKKCLVDISGTGFLANKKSEYTSNVRSFKYINHSRWLETN